MATKVRVERPGRQSDYEVEGQPVELCSTINRAIKSADKFVTFKATDGKQRSLIADTITAVWEE